MELRGVIRGSTKEVPNELRERAVRLYRESDPKPVIRHLARQDEADRGQRDDRPTTSEWRRCAGCGGRTPS